MKTFFYNLVAWTLSSNNRTVDSGYGFAQYRVSSIVRGMKSIKSLSWCHILYTLGLALKDPFTNATDDIHKYVFIVFRRK